MAGSGDYLFYQKTYEAKFLDRVILATDTTAQLAAIITVRNAFYQLYIQKVTLSPTTYAAQTLTFQDTAGTPVKLGLISVPATAPTTGGQSAQYLIDFGPRGFAMTLGKNLDIIVSAAGIGGLLHIEAYQKLGSTAVSIANS
jgi:hypothetical protein